MAKASEKTITPEVLNELLDYNPQTGELTWKRRDERWFLGKKRSPQWLCRMWNSTNAGKPALTARHSEGYRMGHVVADNFYAHRVIWAMVYGYWPKNVDHINGDRSDNRVENLREVTPRGNCLNVVASARNKSGIVGVYFEKGKWQAMIHHNGKRINLGRFSSKEDAAKARKAAEAKYGYHENHGRAA